MKKIKSITKSTERKQLSGKQLALSLGIGAAVLASVYGGYSYISSEDEVADVYQNPNYEELPLESNNLEEGVEADGGVEVSTNPETAGIPPYFEEGSDEEQGTFYPSLGQEATYNEADEDITEAVGPKKWFSLSEVDETGEEVNPKKVIVKNVSEKANSAYNKLIVKINEEKKYKEGLLNPSTQPNEVLASDSEHQNQPTVDEQYYNNLLNESNQFAEKLKNENGELNSAIHSMQTQLESAKGYEEMYMALLNNKNNLGPTPISDTDIWRPEIDPPEEEPAQVLEPEEEVPTEVEYDYSEPIEDKYGNTIIFDGEMHTLPNISVPSKNPSHDGEGRENVDQVTPREDAVITDLSQIATIGSDRVILGDDNQFYPLKELKKEFFLVIPSHLKISDYFQQMLEKYKDQLLVNKLNYARVSGFSNLYKMTASYHLTEMQFKFIRDDARKFNEQSKTLTDKEYLNKLAEYVAGKATYGDAEYGGETIFSPYTLVIGYPVVCQAYTAYSKIFLDDRGLDNTIQTGTLNLTPHVWNVVELDGKYYHYDFTVYDTTKDMKYLGATESNISSGRTLDKLVK